MTIRKNAITKKKFIGRALALCGVVAIMACCTDGLMAQAQQTQFDYTAYAQTYAPQTGILDAPTVVFWARSAFDLAALDCEKTPSVVVFTVDGAGNAVDEQGQAIATLDEAVRACANRMIPALYFSDSAGKDAALSYVAGKNLLDAIVLSDDAQLVASFKAQRANIQGGVCFPEADLTDHEKIVHIRDTVNRANDMIAVVGGTVTREGVEAIRSLGLSCWTFAESTQIGVYQALWQGADGLVMDNFSLPIAIFEGISQPLLVRKVFYSGHRGDSTYPENTLVGAQAAYYYGADYIELDLMRTQDNELIVMHDATLNRTCNYSGSKQVSQMTLEEIRTYRVDGQYEIPVLEDFLQFAAARPDVKLLIELKTDDPEVVPILTRKLDAFDIDDQIIVISGYNARLADLHAAMPHISINTLNSYKDIQSLAYYAYTLNCSFGPGYTYLDSTLVLRQARERGIPVYAWTFRTASVYEEYMALCTSLTSDSAVYAKEQLLALQTDGQALYSSAQTLPIGGTATLRQRTRVSYEARQTRAAELSLTEGAQLAAQPLDRVAGYENGVLSVGTQQGYGIYFFSAVCRGQTTEYAIMSQPFEVCVGAEAYHTPLNEERFRALSGQTDPEPGTDSEPGTDPEPQPQEPEGGCTGCGSLGFGGTGCGTALLTIALAAGVCLATLGMRRTKHEYRHRE